MSEQTKDQCCRLLNGLEMPPGRIIVPHVKLKQLKGLLNSEYRLAAESLLKSLYELYQPKTVLVPSFTYTFTKSGIFHQLFSRSEVGRFSEEVRNTYLQSRTPNPIFSFVDTGKYLQFDEIDHKTAFGKDSIFDFLDQEDCVILNIDLEKIVQTQIHYVEKKNLVHYRYDKRFEGVIYYNEKKWEKINYLYYVRDLSVDPRMNYEKREQYLIDYGVLNLKYSNGIKISWTTAKMLDRAITEAIAQDPDFLINEG